METNYVKCGDSSYLLKGLPDESVDMVLTSPPYGKLRKYSGFVFDFPSVAKELARVMKRGAVLVWICSDQTLNGSETCQSFKQALGFKEEGLNLYDTMIWRKPNPSVPTESRYYNAFEYMFVFSKGKPKALNFICDRPNKGAGSTYRHYTHMNPEHKLATDRINTVKEFSRRHNVWDIPVGKNPTSHPAVFPEQLALDHVKTWSNEGDLVLDPFAGSGTTLIAAKKLKRNYIGFDISQEYCDMSEQRLKEVA